MGWVFAIGVVAAVGWIVLTLRDIMRDSDEG